MKIADQLMEDLTKASGFNYQFQISPFSEIK